MAVAVVGVVVQQLHAAQRADAMQVVPLVFGDVDVAADVDADAVVPAAGCGADLNRQSCACPPQNASSPFAALEALRGAPKEGDA